MGTSIADEPHGYVGGVVIRVAEIAHVNLRGRWHYLVRIRKGSVIKGHFISRADNNHPRRYVSLVLTTTGMNYLERIDVVEVLEEASRGMVSGGCGR